MVTVLNRNVARPRRSTRLWSILLAGTCLAPIGAAGQNNWLGVTSDYRAATNWSAGNPPPPNGTGTFGSAGFNVTLPPTDTVTVGGLAFASGANAYTFVGNGLTLTNTGVGASTAKQTFNISGLDATNSASLGNATYNVFSVNLRDNSTAGSATLNVAFFTFVAPGATLGAATVAAAQDGAIILRGSGGSAAVTLANRASLIVDENASTSTTLGSIAGTPGTQISLGSKQLAVGGNNASTTFGGTIADSNGGSLVKQGGGTLILTGNNTYSGGTFISGGALQIGAGGTTGSILGNVVNNGALVFDRSGSVTLDGVISGSGQVVKYGTGTVILSGINSYTGNTTINAGTLAVSNGSALGTPLNPQTFLGGPSLYLSGGTLLGTADLSMLLNSVWYTSGQAGTVAVAAGTTLTFSPFNVTFEPNTRVVFGSPSATGTVVFVGAFRGGAEIGTLGTADWPSVVVAGGTLTGSGGAYTQMLGRAASVTVDKGATLRSGDAAEIGSLQGAGTVDLRGHPLTLQAGNFGGAIVGAGNLAKVGGGTLVLSGANTYTGATTVSGGTLTLTGSLAGNVANAATFQHAGRIGGSVVNSAGGVFVNNGQVTGSFDNFGILSGSGTINGALGNTGTIAPGNSIGTLNVAGNHWHFGSGSYQAEVNGSGQGDLINVAGTASLQGGTVSVAALPGAPFAPRTTYKILTAAGGLTGAYATVVDPYPFLQSSLSYDANNAYLTLQIGGFTAAAQTTTQSAVGRVLDANVSSATGDFATILGTLAPLQAGQVLPFMTSISGQNNSSFSSTMVQGAQLFMNNFANQTGGGSPVSNRVALAEACDVACDAATQPLWGAWGGALGGLGTIGANAGTGGVTYNAGGFAAGLDRLVAPGVRVGVTTGYTNGPRVTSDVSP